MIELFSADTPNGKKIGIMLEEIGWDYKVTKVNIFKDEQFKSEINVVYGNEWNAGNLSYHLKSRPAWEGVVKREKLDELKDYMCLDNVCVGSR